MTRHARCACGQLSLSVTGEPFAVLLCNCAQCQRRTGSAYGLGAYFAGAQVTALRGEASRYRKTADSGRQVEFHFCPACGTSLYWTAPGAATAEGLGVAVGCFADPDFPKPVLAAWCEQRLAWAPLPAGIAEDARQPDRLPGLL